MSEAKVRWAAKTKHGGWVKKDGSFVVDKGKRTLWILRREAMAEAATWSEHHEVRLVRVKRTPKRPPPLAVGDEVVVRGKVVGVNHLLGYAYLAFQEPPKQAWTRIDINQCERPGWWNGCKP